MMLSTIAVLVMVVSVAMTRLPRALSSSKVRATDFISRAGSVPYHLNGSATGCSNWDKIQYASISTSLDECGALCQLHRGCRGFGYQHGECEGMEQVGPLTCL